MASASEYDSLPRPAGSALRTGIVRPLQFVGFWTAVVSPFVLVGLVVRGLATQHPLLWTGLLAANLVGIVLGKEYNR